MCHFAQGGHVTGNNNHKIFPSASMRISRLTAPFITQLNERAQESEYKIKGMLKSSQLYKYILLADTGVTFFLLNLQCKGSIYRDCDKFQSMCKQLT